MSNIFEKKNQGVSLTEAISESPNNLEIQAKLEWEPIWEREEITNKVWQYKQQKILK